MSTIVTDSIEPGVPAPLQAILIDPYARSVRSVDVPSVPRPCGCADADGHALVDLLGRHQQAHEVLDGEILVVGTGGCSAAWAWGSIPCTGYGLLLGGHWAHAFASSRAAVGDVAGCVTWGPKRRSRGRTLERTDGAIS
jgi:hypothetical protein